MIEPRSFMKIRPDSHFHPYWLLTGPGCSQGVLINTCSTGWTSLINPRGSLHPWLLDGTWITLWNQRSVVPTDSQGNPIPWAAIEPELVYLDLAGNPIEVAKYIVYAATFGQSSVLKYGIVTRRTFAVPSNYRAEPNIPKIGVITYDTDIGEVQKNGQEQILGYLDRMLAIDAGQVPIGARTALCDAFDKWNTPKTKAAPNGGGNSDHKGNGSAG